MSVLKRNCIIGVSLRGPLDSRLFVLIRDLGPGSLARRSPALPFVFFVLFVDFYGVSRASQSLHDGADEEQRTGSD